MTALPYFIAVSDGASIRTIHPPALGEHRAAVEAAIASALGPPPGPSNFAAFGSPMLPVDEKWPQPEPVWPRPVYDVMGISPEEVSAQVAHKPGPATTDMLTQGEIARVQGFTGDTCTVCQGFSMRRNGTCLLCVDCGATTGCS